MISRRKMFGFAAALPLAATGLANTQPAIAKTRNDADRPDGDVPIITLQAQRQKALKGGNEVYSIVGYESVGQPLGISVGKDGHMWLKINNEWKKVVVE